jgi:hypothetical protein
LSLGTKRHKRLNSLCLSEVCRFGIGQQDCCCDICTTSKRCR